MKDGLIKYKVSFRIGGDMLDPIEITNILGIPADRSHRKGDANTSISKKGKIIHYSSFGTGLWALETKEDETAVLECHIKSLLAILYPLKDKLKEINQKGYKMDIFCGVFTYDAPQPGFDLSSETLLQLGELNIALGMCIYP